MREARNGLINDDRRTLPRTLTLPSAKPSRMIESGPLTVWCAGGQINLAQRLFEGFRHHRQVDT
jgi:hypothetical protein